MNETFAFILMILMTICATCIVISSFFRIDYFKSEYWMKKLEEEMAHGDDPKLRRYMLIKTALYVVIIMIFVTLLSFTPVRKWLSWMPDTLVAALFISPIAFWLWHWRDQNKLKDQEHTERDLKIKENNDAWVNFTKFQETVLDEKKPPALRVAAVYALGEYFTRPKDSNFPLQVHEFFRDILKNYWKIVDNCAGWNARDLDSYIPVIHRVVIQKIKWLEQHDLHDVNFSFANLHNACFKGLDLSGARFCGAILIGANFEDANLSFVFFNNACLSGATFKGANLYGANLERATFKGANFEGAKYDFNTAFPEGFNPEKAGMIRIDK